MFTGYEVVRMNHYIQYYGLSENPFDISPDSKYFFPSESHKEALASLLYVVKERKGFMLLIGENGTGKTVLINQLIGSLDENVNVVCFPQGNLPFEQILKELLIKLGLPLERANKGTMVHQLNEYLIQNLARGKNLILIIDEAQDIPRDVLEELRLTSNLETSTSKLLQIIFVGWPELETKLHTKGLRQLKQRIGIISRITRLSLAESMEYIDHRLLHAGGNSNDVFSPEALALICKYADGVPRKINVLCHNALFKGFESSEKPISASTVRKIRNEENLLADKKAGNIASGNKQKSHSISTKANIWLKRSFYFCIAAGCIVLAVLLGKDYLKNTPEIPQIATYSKPLAVSEKTTIKDPVIEEVVTKAPVIEADSAAKNTQDATSENNQPATSPSEALAVSDKIPLKEPVIEKDVTKAPVIETNSVSKFAPDATPKNNQAAASPSAEVSPKPSVAPARTEIRYKKIVDIEQGANLSSLILNNYNQVNTTLMDFILAFNLEIVNPDLILVGQKIRIPEITESNLIAKLSDGSIKAHLGTFSTSQEALNYKNFINIKDKKIEIIPRNISPDKIWFRVMAGPFTNEEDCLKTIQAFRQRGLLPAFGRIPNML